MLFHMKHYVFCYLDYLISYLFSFFPLFISCLTDGVVFQHSVVVAACVVSHETLRIFLYLTSLFRFFSHFFFLMLLVRFSATKVDCFYPFSLLFSLFFARFFSFFLSQLVVPASRGHRDSDLSFPFSSFRLFCSYFLAVFLISVLSDDCFFMFFLIYFLIICPNGLVFYFYFLSVLFFLYLPSNFIFDLFFFPLHGSIFLFFYFFCCLFEFFDRFWY